MTITGWGAADANEDVMEYRWDFGDGNQAVRGATETEVVQHTYDGAVAGTVTDQNGRVWSISRFIQEPAS